MGDRPYVVEAPVGEPVSEPSQDLVRTLDRIFSLPAIDAPGIPNVAHIRLARTTGPTPKETNVAYRAAANFWVSLKRVWQPATMRATRYQLFQGSISVFFNVDLSGVVLAREAVSLMQLVRCSSHGKRKVVREEYLDLANKLELIAHRIEMLAALGSSAQEPTPDPTIINVKRQK